MKEYGVWRQNDAGNKLWRRFSTRPEAEDWIKEWLEDGGKPIFHIAERDVTYSDWRFVG
jgi:hypothetical protein